MTRPTITCALRKLMSLTASCSVSQVRASILLLALLASRWTPAHGLATNSEEIRSHGLLGVGMSGDYAPFGVDASGGGL